MGNGNKNKKLKSKTMARKEFQNLPFISRWEKAPGGKVSLEKKQFSTVIVQGLFTGRILIRMPDGDIYRGDTVYSFSEIKNLLAKKGYSFVSPKACGLITEEESREK